MIRSTSSALAVQITMGTSRVSGSLRICRHTSVPGTSGSMRSSSTTSGMRSRTSASARSPEPASRVSNPAARRLTSRSSSMSCSSSTMSTVGTQRFSRPGVELPSRGRDGSVTTRRVRGVRRRHQVVTRRRAWGRPFAAALVRSAGVPPAVSRPRCAICAATPRGAPRSSPLLLRQSARDSLTSDCMSTPPPEVVSESTGPSPGGGALSGTAIDGAPVRAPPPPQIAAGVTETSADGLTPTEQLAAVRREALRLRRALAECLHEQLVPELERAGIHLLDYPQLNDIQVAAARKYFDEMVFPVLTPLAFDPGRPFPHISNMSLNLALLVRDGDVERFARVKVPDTLPRLVPLGRSSGALDTAGAAHRHHTFIWLEQLIAANVDRLFPGLEAVGVHEFHVTRDAEMMLQEMEAADLLASVEHGVRDRRFGAVVGLAVTPRMPGDIRDLLVENLGVDSRDAYAVEAPLGLSDLGALHGIERSDLKFPPFLPATPARLVGGESDEDVFTTIRRQDVLLHHPFDSFTPVIEFLRAAARDPDVLAIKQTLYRVGRDSPVIEALLDASRNRKQVAVLVELKARFDEESNIGWAKALEAEGVHVIYGLLGLKTHSKVALVVRREGDRLARYVHLSTGNYNPVTAGLYTDLGFITADPDIGEDATHLFNYLTGYSKVARFKKLLVAPIDLRERLLGLIEREIEHQRAGRGGHLVFKINT